MAGDGALVCCCAIRFRPVQPWLKWTQRAEVWTRLCLFVVVFFSLSSQRWYITADLKVFVIATHGAEGLWRAGWEFWWDNSDTQWKETLHSTGVKAVRKKNVSNRTYLDWMRKQTGILTATRNYIINQQCIFFTRKEMELKQHAMIQDWKYNYKHTDDWLWHTAAINRLLWSTLIMHGQILAPLHKPCFIIAVQ